jgi:hypothetical protein
MGNTIHRPPHATFKIKEMIEVGEYDEAQKCTDENEEFFQAKITEQGDLFIEAQKRKMGVQSS